MLFPIAIDRGDESHAFGVAVPDIPGCFSAGDTLEQALVNVHEAIGGHLSCLDEMGAPIPQSQGIERHMNDPEYAGWVWAVVDVDISRYLGKAEKVNVTLPGNLVRRIDDAVAAGAVDGSGGRSRFLAEAAFEKLQRLRA